MSPSHVIVYSEDESLASIVTEFLLSDELSVTRHGTRIDLYDTVRTLQPATIVVVQPCSDRSWLSRLVETIHWDPGISTQVIVVTHEPDQIHLKYYARSGYVAGIVPMPFDFSELCRMVHSLIENARIAGQLNAATSTHHADAGSLRATDPRLGAGPPIA